MKRKITKKVNIEELLFVYSTKEDVERRNDYINENGDYVYPYDIEMKEPNSAYGSPKGSLITVSNYVK